MDGERFELIGQVARTARSVVWKARDRGLDRFVALKQLPSTDPALRAQWREEARLLGMLDDPHVVAVYGLHEDAVSAWLVEQWIDGATLSAVLRQAGRLAPEQALGVIRGALLGLSHAHARGLVHRDLSLSNILLNLAGESVLIDFGIAAATGAPGTAGTAAFQSPEARAGMPVTALGDIFSIGAILGHLLLGTATGGQIEQPMRDVVERATRMDPAQRFGSAEELLRALEEAAERRYGPAWLLQSGVSALVSAVGAVELLAPGTAAVAGAGIASAPAAAGSPVLATIPPAPPPPPLPPEFGAGAQSAPAFDAARARPRLLRPRLLALGGGAVAAAVVVTVVLVNSGDDKKRPVAQVSSSPAPTTSVPAPTTPTTSSSPPPTPADHFAGTYSVREQIVTSKHFDRSSTALVDTWTVRAQCTGSSCTALVSAANGPPLQFTMQGTTWVSTTAGQYGCVTPGQQIGVLTERTVLTPQGVAADGTITTLTGRQTVTSTGGDCPSTVRFTITMTRVAGAPSSVPTTPTTPPVATSSSPTPLTS